MSDDEKFIFKDGNKATDLMKFNELAYKNAKDIIACGFDINKTFIFSNLETNGGDLYFNNILIAKATSMNSIKGTYGIGETVDEPILNVVKKALEDEKSKPNENQDSEKIRSFEKLIKNNVNKDSNSIGQCMWPVFQCGPAFVTSFRKLFISSLKNALIKKGESMPENVAKNMKKALKELTKIGSTQSICCLVPMAIDQAPYFRMARDVASTLNHPKPAVIHSEFMPGLNQAHGKMSSTSNQNATLFLDMNPKKIADTIKRHAFSGGQDTLDKHRELGGDVSVDICYQYLTYFMDNDIMLEEIAKKYSNGELSTGELKTLTSELVTKEIEEHQKAKSSLTDEQVKEFFNPNRILDIGGCYDRTNIIDIESTDYTKYGINFDRTFGYKPKFKRVNQKN